jgi:ligand-binding sensor domain-containing protein
MKKNILILTILLISNILCNAQSIGEWTTHTPGLEVISVDIMHEKVFSATSYDIYYYNIADNSINHLSKVNGLSDIGISVIRHDKTSDVIFVGYTDTNIDIIDNQDNVINIPDIYNKYILGDKTINNVFFNSKFAYVCCGFGIVVIDMQRMEVKDTYIIGNNGSYLCVNDLTICDGIFYAATVNGIYYADVDNPQLADFSQWKRIGHGLPHSTSNFSNIETFDNYVVTSYAPEGNLNDELIIINDTLSWSYFVDDQFNTINEIRTCDNLLVLTIGNSSIKVYDTDKNVVFNKTGSYPNSTLFDKSRNCYWAGTKYSSLVHIDTQGNPSAIRFNGPFNSNVFEVNASGSDVWVAPGGYTSTWAPTWKHYGFYHYNGDSWSFNTWEHVFDSVVDITCVKPKPQNQNIVYAASYSKGLLVFENDVCTHIYDYHNSSLGKHLSMNYTFVTGFDFDSGNNMWLANSGTDKMLSVWRTNGTWEAFNIGTSDISHIMVDSHDNKWILQRDGTIIVFNGSVVKTVSSNADQGNLPGLANCFVTDNNGTVWVGTSDGVALFTDSRKIFNNNSFACTRILIPRNDGSGQADYLLSGQSVLSIAVDGSNKMWFGTNDGVLHTSNDGQTNYHHFTTENSPLFSNTVKDMAIDDDGIIYFATDKGLISYKGTASKGQEKNSNVIVYPNPVRPEHRGIVGIKGLVNDALVKITTTNGTFVTHLQAEGGQAVWDCTDIKGRNVEPGIYLIFVSDESGKETYATKVLIMK